jgi:hypothetical protein
MLKKKIDVTVRIVWDINKWYVSGQVQTSLTLNQAVCNINREYDDIALMFRFIVWIRLREMM